ncbi:MAG TPA: acyl-CoA dehydrogenase family protein [Mycobacteriales bacterium]|nr:acyl-CoA dehydrogenase family protein [Mycobacteriales bacterium]
MNLTVTEEQRAIVATVADLLDAVGRDDPEGLWAGAVELGWFGLGLPEELGGTGYGLVEEALVAKEVGRHVTPGPLVATVLATRVAAYGGEEALAADLMSGAARAALALAGHGDELTLLDAATATHAVVVRPELAAVVAIEACADRSVLPSLDELSTRESARLVGAPIVSVSSDVDAVYLRGSVLVSAVLAGIAQAGVEMSTDFAKTREQFGAPIGSFQAVKHTCADMAIAAAVADAQLVVAALSVAEGQPDADVQVAALRVVSTRSATSNARANVQVHGGMGFTWECPAHFYAKRVHALAGVLGSMYDNERVLVPRVPA